MSKEVDFGVLLERFTQKFIHCSRSFRNRPSTTPLATSLLLGNTSGLWLPKHDIQVVVAPRVFPPNNKTVTLETNQIPTYQTQIILPISPSFLRRQEGNTYHDIKQLFSSLLCTVREVATNRNTVPSLTSPHLRPLSSVSAIP
jgi:hypothetical protein